MISNPGQSIENNILFLQGGGEMGRLTREFDWASTNLGSPEQWPQSLKSILSLLLNSRFPMFLFWGAELTCFYNDAYRPSLGNNGKHPFLLGAPAEAGWSEIWPVIKPLIDQVLSGQGATFSEDQLIPIYRNGQLEDVYWTFSYIPVVDESGSPAGGVRNLFGNHGESEISRTFQDQRTKAGADADAVTSQSDLFPRP